MDVWTKHKSVHNAPQPTEPQHTDQVGGSQVPPKTEHVISTIDRIKRLKKHVGSVIKKKFRKVPRQIRKTKKLMVKNFCRS